MSDTQVSLNAGDPIQFKSKLGYTYDGTVTALPDATSNRYVVLTAEGATALVDPDDVIVPEPKVDPSLTPEQLASARAEHLRQTADRLATEAMQTLYATVRERAREEGVEFDEDATDELRVEVTQVFADASAKLRDAMAAQVEDKRTRPKPEVAPTAGTDEAP